MCIDYDPPQMYREEMRKAAKDHACEECRRIIKRGERYEYVAGRWEDDFNTFKTCAHCVGARSWLLKECAGFVHGGVLEDLEEHRYEGQKYGARLLRLIVGIRRDWKRFKGDGLMTVPPDLKAASA